MALSQSHFLGGTMFKFGRGLFGRKGSERSFNTPDLPSSDSNMIGLTIDDIRARCQALARSGRYSDRYYMHEVLMSLSPSERTMLFISFAEDVEILDKYDRSDARDSWIRECHRKCLDVEMHSSREHLPALLTLLLNDKNLQRYYYAKQFTAMTRLINQAIKDGAFFTSVDLELLGGLANSMRASSEKERSKAHKKILLRKAEAIEKLAGLEVSTTSLLLERCGGAENPFAMAEKPVNYEFWSILIAEVITGLHAIKEELQGKSKPIWMKDAKEFVASWPQVGPITPCFGAWKDHDDPKLRDFATLRGYTKRRHKGMPGFADADRVRSLSVLRERYAPTMNWRWNTPQIPAIEILGDLELPQWTALIEHLISGKVAPRPTGTWLKQGVKLASDIGAPEVAARLNAWLALFHSPALNPVSLADRNNVEEMDRTVAYLNEQLPDWPAMLAKEDLGKAGRSLAMVVACQGNKRLVKPFEANLMECDDHIWEGKSATIGNLRIKCPVSALHTGGRYYDNPGAWLFLSIENESLLRGAMWLASEISSRDVAIATLEAIAQAGAARIGMGDQGHRSRVVANAAIATLIDKGGADVDAAILRLSSMIPDRTINMPLFKALNRNS
jgi:hypothetical protein